jgi:peptidoglycan hydrolase-like protein with peptidoglycan-binding domain
MRRARRTVAITAAIGLCAAAVGVAVVGTASHGGDPAAAATEDAAVATVKVERRDLVETDSVDGELGYGDERAVPGSAQGTVTAIAPAGAVVQRGQTLYEVDGVAVPLFYGARPFWRTLDTSADDGEDIRELEENLVALGYGDDGLVVDTEFDSATRRAVKRWQDALGRDDTGVVQASDVVVQADAVRVVSDEVAVGDSAQPGTAVVKVTGTTRIVTMSIDVAQRPFVHGGDAVEVELPDGTRTAGKIAIVGSVATAEQSDDPNGDSTPKIKVAITVDDAKAIGDLDEAPVVVYVTRAATKNATAVPVRALLALAEGGYAVEVRHGNASDLVAVETGAFADGWVEVRGDVQPGDRVVVAQ